MILYQQNLDGQAIAGEPFSYIGECSCVGTIFTGNWNYLSLYKNNLADSDWRKARTRWSYSRENNMKGMKTSPVVHDCDHEMMIAVVNENLPNLTGNAKAAAEFTLDFLGQANYQATWVNFAYRFHDFLGNDKQVTLDTLEKMLVWPHLVKSAMQGVGIGDEPGWEEGPPPDPTQLMEVDKWGVYIKTKKGVYAKKAIDLPQPTHPHDRWEMADLIEAEILAATGAEVTLYIYWIEPWWAKMEAQSISRGSLVR